MLYIEKFLEQHSRWIHPVNCARLRLAAKNTILHGENINLDGCPEDLRERLRIVILESAYRHEKRQAGSIFNVDSVLLEQTKVMRSLRNVILPYRQKKLY